MSWEEALNTLWGQLGFAGLVAYFVLAIWRGWLVSKAQVDRMEKSYQDHIERLERERREQIEDWKSALQIREAGNKTLLSQNTKLLEVVYRVQSANLNGGQGSRSDVSS